MQELTGRDKTGGEAAPDRSDRSNLSFQHAFAACEELVGIERLCHARMIARSLIAPRRVR